MNRIAIVASMVFTLALPLRTEAANPGGANSDKQQLLQVLKSESQDNLVSVDRRSILQAAAHPATASNATWWQSGFVKTGDGWQDAGKSPANSDSALLNEYRAQRDATPKTLEGHLQLANWCQSQKLSDQERAHLSEALLLSVPGVDRTPIYRRMGYRQIGPDWVSPAELTDLQEKYRQTEERLREWRPKLERIVRNWGGNARQRKAGLDELRGIESAAAVPALLTASSVDESLAMVICDQLNTIDSYEASQALSMIAVQSEWASVRQTAAKSLKGRRITDFAPMLLTQMRSPFSTLNENPTAAEPRLFFREEANRYYAVDLRLVPVIGRVAILGPTLRNSKTRSDDQYTQLENQLASRRNSVDGARYVADVDHELQQRVDEANDRTEEFNKRAAAVLAEVSGQEPCNNARYWWTWWHLYTGTQPPPKQCQVDHRLTPVATLPNVTRAVMSAVAHSCLVAGTPICTDRGFVAVDKIQVGDRVLAKDIDTGEIEYKPVVHTTVRRPVRVKKFVVGGEPIVASAEHHFWISGSGWSKTRDLKPGQPAHTATGMSRVESVEDEPEPAPVFNLIVADFHTYFIGPVMVLSHDVTQPVPTNIKVPGLDGK